MQQNEAAILPKLSNRILRGTVQALRGGERKVLLAKNVHRALYRVYEGVARHLARGFAMEKQTCLPNMTDVDVLEHVIRFDRELVFLLSDLPAAQERHGRWNKGEQAVLTGSPHYKLKSALRRALRNERKGRGTDNPRIMLDLVAMFLFVMDEFFLRVARTLVEVLGLGNGKRSRVTAADMSCVLRWSSPGQPWVHDYIAAPASGVAPEGGAAAEPGHAPAEPAKPTQLDA